MRRLFQFLPFSFITARGAPPPRALARGRRFAALPSGRSLGPQALFLFLSLSPFVLLCTLNSAGYRYGASDLAFYIPAALERLDPSLFPRDRALIASQARLTMIDETIAILARASRLTLPSLFAALYVLTLALLLLGAWLIARRLYRFAWTTMALAAALTLKHEIAKSGTNTLEGYFHPRQLAFSLGTLAVAALMRRRFWIAAVLVIAGGMLHPTTALWFGIWLGVATWINEPRWRPWLTASAVVAIVAGMLLVTVGPLAGRLVIMDPEWLATLVTKDYLFPLEWPAYVWFLNLAYLPVIWFIYRRRIAAGVVAPGETGIVFGCLSLVLVFAAALPLNAARVALVIQLQIPRIFWMLDFLAVAYSCWALVESGVFTRRRAAAVVCTLVLASSARSAYIKFVRFPERPIAQIRVPDTDWGRAMAWARTTPHDSNWLAHPLHAVQYGSSLRVAGERDVFVEGVKDAAIGMYERDVAIRTRDRLLELQDYDGMTPDRARALAATYGLDFMVSEEDLALPIAYSSGSLRVYRVRPDPGSRPSTRLRAALRLSKGRVPHPD